MKKIISVFCIFTIICSLFASCSSVEDLNKAGNDYADTVMNNIGSWENADGKYCIMLQIYDIDGQYYLYCGYDSGFAEHNNEAINRYAPSVYYRYAVTETTFGSAEKTSVDLADYFLNQNKPLSSSVYYYNDTYEEKYELVASLFDKID